MKLRVIAPQSLQLSTIELPPSKSIANRVLVLSALNGIAPQQVLPQPIETLCDDIRVMVQLLQSVLSEKDAKNKETQLNVGAAGTAMRFATAFLSVQSGTHTITGTERLQQRPIGILVNALRQLGAHIDYLGNEGYPPLRITGNPTMQGGSITLDGSISSQFISALLMIAPIMCQGLIIHLQGQLVSTPYLHITTQLMRQFGAQVEWTDDRTITVKHWIRRTQDSSSVLDHNLSIESDWTAASYWYEIAALSESGWLLDQVQTLRFDSLQGDRVCHEIFHRFTECLYAHEPFHYDFEDCPDLVQTLAVTCCMKNVPFCFTGLRTLRIKETDRISALQIELSKMGFPLQATDDMLSWDGTQNSPQTSFSIATYHDHRMAMAFAPCALRLGEIIIDDPEVVNKSYPTYWDDLQKIGFTLCHI